MELLAVAQAMLLNILPWQIPDNYVNPVFMQGIRIITENLRVDAQVSKKL
jgi:hypothetical protein